MDRSKSTGHRSSCVTLNFATILSEIEPPKPGREGDTRYRVREIPEARHFIGRDSSGHPCLLLDSRGHSSRTPIRLALLEVQFAIACRISDDREQEHTQTLTAIICRSHDPVMTAYFAHVAQTIVSIVGAAPLGSEVAQAVRRLTELFQNLSRPSGRSVIGLFGELLVIHLSRSPRISLTAWRSTVDNRFDFSIDDVRVEAKSSSDRARAHNFSREQCMPPDGTVGILISLFVERSGGGLSIRELADRIERQLAGDADLTLRLHATIAETLGDATAAAMEMRFDEHLARSSIRLYDLLQVPAVRDDLPSEVSQVRFRVDIGQVPTADLSDLEQRSHRVRDLLPQSA
jgi:Putative  PD-(D/E)XK family member, (DUF4420)